MQKSPHPQCSSQHDHIWCCVSPPLSLHLDQSAAILLATWAHLSGYHKVSHCVFRYYTKELIDRKSAHHQWSSQHYHIWCCVNTQLSLRPDHCAAILFATWCLPTSVAAMKLVKLYVFKFCTKVIIITKSSHPQSFSTHDHIWCCAHTPLTLPWPVCINLVSDLSSSHLSGCYEVITFVFLNT